jgi:hypothetical protein
MQTQITLLREPEEALAVEVMEEPVAERETVRDEVWAMVPAVEWEGGVVIRVKPNDCLWPRAIQEVR